VGKVRPFRPGKRGQTLPLFAVSFVAILGFAGLALDGARLYAEHERMQGAADAAAIGAAQELRRGNLDYAGSLLPAAIHDAALHGVAPEEAEIVVQYPPVSGAFAGSPEHVEVVVRTEMATTFMGMFGRLSEPVSARAVAGLAAGEAPCLLALARSGAGAVTVEGTQPLTIDCPAGAASRDAAAWVSGEACVDAVGGLVLAGGASGACIRGEVAAGAAAPDDFLAGLRMPSCAGRSPGVAEIGEDGSVYYWPGCYGAPVEIASGSAQLMPGVHIFTRGLHVTGGEVTGDGVTLLFPASSGQTGVAIEAAAAVRLRAPSSGDFAGVLMFAEKGGAAHEAEIARRTGSELEGALYFPGRTLRWAPNDPGSRAWVRAVADRIVVLEGAGGRAIGAAPDGVRASQVAALVE
jgi:hypothetical protein